MHLRVFQEEVGRWGEKNFGDIEENPPENPLLGMAEEVGELCHAHLKGKQGIRYTSSKVEEMKKDAIGDLFIYAAHYCHLNGYDLSQIVEQTWNKVSKRNWRDNPNDAHLQE